MTNSRLTIGSKHGLASVIVKDDMITGWKFKIFGYMSMGESVPEVITTVWNRSKTGFMAIDESKQLKCKMGLDTVGVLSSKGSTIMVNPLV
jgi:hypothetical protein